MDSERQRFYKHKIKTYYLPEKDNASGSSSKDLLKFDSSIKDTPNEYKERCDDNVDTGNFEDRFEPIKDYEVVTEITVELEPDKPDEEKETDIDKSMDKDETAQIKPNKINEEKRRISNESLQPTITEIIEEKDMEELRKSLEDGYRAEEIDIQGITKENSEEKKQRKRSVIRKSYIDFLSEDEDFIWDSTSWKETDESSNSSTEQDQHKKKIKKKKRSNTEDGKVGDAGLKKKKINKRNVRKEARSKGEQYVKKDGTLVKQKELKPNPCLNKNCPYKCGEIDTEKRRNIFEYFWKLSSQRKKEWLLAMTSKQAVKRKRSKDSNYRNNTFNYFINDGEGRRQVCLKFIMNTLDISQRYIYYTLTTQLQGISKEDGRGKCIPANKTPDEIKESAKNFIKSLPAVSSHYCRKDSTKLYLPTELKNIKNLYRIYKEDRTSKGIDVVNEKIFRNIFNTDFNIGFHVPKKDKCSKCLRFEGKKPEDCVELQAHLDEKDASKRRLQCHRELGKENPSILCTSFDLQKVLNTPHGNSMLLFYARKYAVYNLCFYESITRNGFCFIWGESEAKRGANEIATILNKYIEDVDSRGTIKILILYSDSCPGQNKNRLVLAAVHNALLHSKNLESIQMNYLLPGHTEMTVDSIHSTIEQSVRNTIVWAPSQWATVCQLARKEPAPYYVENLTHEDFLSFDDMAEKYFKGNLTGKISQIRTATFKKSSPSLMKIKFSMKDDAQEETIGIHAKPKVINKRYKARLPITKAKYMDLKKLCDTGVIPKIYHKEYLQLQSVNAKDVLVDTDIEDDSENNE